MIRPGWGGDGRITLRDVLEALFHLAVAFALGGAAATVFYILRVLQ